MKFKRSDDPEAGADWMIAALEGELPKIEKLISRGAQRYIIATNARGTAHLDSGKIDRVQRWLDQHVAIPSVCYWRDEIDRRLDAAEACLKLKYSEILTLEDGVSIVFTDALEIANQRRDDAIHAFVLKQYNDDSEIKFKQLDLVNDLLSLFVDVPVAFIAKERRRTVEGIAPLAANPSYTVRSTAAGFEVLDMAPSEPRPLTSLGAGRLLLEMSGGSSGSRIVLEGAPGQGKSTLAQFVCQIHRAKFLGRSEFLNRVPSTYKVTAFRLPIKIDLRDFSKFLEGKNPFDVGESSKQRTRSLEGFIGDLIDYGSGGVTLETHEVQQILTKAPVLLFLDGLDEVADIAIRRKVVKLTGESLTRLHEFGADLQVIVTSRPSVFGKVNNFKRYGFLDSTLTSLDNRRIKQYADKWISARKLKPAESDEIRQILSEKLKLEHFRELTKNPMQLTILLTLIRQVGYSLPDQRTELYDKYLELFFIREAEISRVIHENRDALIGFVEFLAWFLQSNAESEGTSGSISEDDLKDLSRSYLKEMGYAGNLADDLFGGGLERIYVLVERIEGLFEFEIQPLREYFCAHYLYITAPTPTHRNGNVSGDRSQRFEALAANPFWLNVTRFYAGFHVRGELGNISSSLRELIASPNLAVSIHVRRVGLALLQDRIFTGKRFCQEDVIRSIFDEIGQAIFGLDAYGGSLPRLAPECGQEIVREIVGKRVLRSTDASARIFSLCRLLAINGGDKLEADFILSLEGLTGATRTNQLHKMFRSGAADSMTEEHIWGLINSDNPNQMEVGERVRSAAVQRDGKILGLSVARRALSNAILDGKLTSEGLLASSDDEILNVLLVTLAIPRRVSHYERIDHHTFASVLERGGFADRSVTHFLQDRSIATFARDLSESVGYIFSSRKSSRRYSFSFNGWDRICESARKSFGERWAVRSLAIRIAGLKPENELIGEASLWDEKIPLSRRVRFARMARVDHNWWLQQLSGASTRADRMFWAGVVISWASVANLEQLSAEISRIVDGLPIDEFHSLRWSTIGAVHFGGIRNDRKRQLKIDLTVYSPRAAVLVAVAFDASVESCNFSEKQRRTTEFKSWFKWRSEYDYLAEAIAPRDENEKLQLVIRDIELSRGEWHVSRVSEDRIFDYEPSLEVATNVLHEIDKYPERIVRECVNRMEGNYKPEPLSQLAKRAKWSFE
ncbi:NACHT domain-containing protein [Nocardia sp. NPDC059240]|uniref:NACHT domain-containing protein n=1 Tax=Nocardia sp. NPDC059240 TaxID=3346786 RepID=UPI003680F323